MRCSTISNDERIYEASQHLLAVLVWTLEYLNNHQITFDDRDHFDALEYHLNRLENIFIEIEDRYDPLCEQVKHMLRNSKFPLPPEKENRPFHGNRVRKRYSGLAIVLLLTVVASASPLQGHVATLNALTHGSPNELPHPHLPNVNDVLPYDR